MASEKAGFYDIESNIKDYIKNRDDNDSRFLIEILAKHLKSQSTVLELGMGDGRDLDILKESYQAVGSDYSQIFLDSYRKKHPKADLISLEARTLKTTRKFDCIYSNKVLHHLSKNDLKVSLTRQKPLLNKNGILFHTFWSGNNEATYHDLKFIRYEMYYLEKIVQKHYEVIEIDTYGELLKNDSIYLILKTKSK